MSHPVAEERTQASKFLPVITRHLINQRTLAMNYLIMRQWQYEVLVECIHQGEGQLILMPLTINWVKAYITENVVHPAHVPLIVEAHTAHVYRTGNHWPGGRFLSNHQCLWMLLENGLVQLLNEVHSL